MKNTILSLAILFSFIPAFATHNRAGEITYQFTSANTVQATITTYTKQSSVAADRDSLAIHWGDGSADDILVRTNGPVNSNGIPGGEPLGNDIKKNIYIGSHTYSSAAIGSFSIVSMSDPNRNSNISNISTSVNVPFYIEDTIFFQGQGLNHSPILLYPPIDYANVGDTFFHNPTAYDVEADSLIFELTTPLQGLGNGVPGYFSPEQVPHVAGDTLTIDRHNGLITWAVPQQTGIYNIAVLIREYRNGILLSTIVRDMQIIVNADTTRISPLNGDFTDVTITSGQLFTLPCSAIDADPAHFDHLFATGGPFMLASHSAGFTSTPGQHATGIMTWAPGHNQYKVRETSIITIWSVTNDIIPLSTLRSFRITVVDSSLTTSISDPTLSHSTVKLYPNPAQDILHISSPASIDIAGIYSTDGKLIHSIDASGKTSMDISLDDMSNGTYILRTKDTRADVTFLLFTISH